MQQSQPAPKAVQQNNFPRGIAYIVGNEGAERFSFYGMRQILYVYLSALFIGFMAEDAVSPEAASNARIAATQWTHLFMAGVYLTPMIGAILADRLLGKYRVILWVSLIYVLGHGALAVGGRLAEMGSLGGAEHAMLVGLALIAIGAGGIKPCVSAHLGDQFDSSRRHLIEKVYQIFYFTINFGSFFASLLIPWIYKAYGAEIAFAVPGVLMAVAVFIFWLGRKRYIIAPPKPGGKLGGIDFGAYTLLVVPLLIAIYVLLEVSKPLVHSLTDGEAGEFGRVLTEAAAHYWWLAVIAVAGLVGGLALAHFRQKIREDDGFLAVTFYAIRHRKERAEGEDFWAPARKHFGEEASEGPKAVMRLMVVFSMVSVFWALFDQHSSTWIEQAKSMDLVLRVPEILWNWWLIPAAVTSAAIGATITLLWVSNVQVSRKLIMTVLGGIVVWGVGSGIAQFMGGGTKEVELLPAQIAALNPLLVMIIIPTLSALIYNPMARRGRPLKPLVRMTIGMFVAATSFVAVAIIQLRIQAVGAGQIHVLWQLIPYFLLTMAEVLVSVTGLEFAYTQAPRAMKSTMTGFWQLCVTFGNVLVAFLAPLERLSLATFFWTFAGLMAVAACVFAYLAKSYKGRSYIGSE